MTASCNVTAVWTGDGLHQVRSVRTNRTQQVVERGFNHSAFGENVSRRLSGCPCVTSW